MKYTIEKVDLVKSESEIVGFWRENFPGWPVEKYSLFYKNNPFGESLCWVLKNADNNKIVGTNALFPKRMAINGNTVLAGIAGDLAVAKKHRGHRSAISLQQAVNADYKNTDIEFAYATPNVISEKVGQGAGFKVIGRTVRMVKILKSYGYLKKILRISFLAKLLAEPFDILLKLKSKEKLYKNSDEYACDIVDSYDERFDELWRKAKAQYPVIGERSSEALNWRFAKCSYKNYHTFTLARKQSGELLGYIVYQEIGKNIQIADCFAVDIGKNLNPLLSKFILYHRERDIDIITFYYFGNNSIINQVRKYGFVIRADNRSIIVEVDENYPYRDDVLDKNSWHYLDGDNDGDA
ncbi:MAG: GNAT family N-acetyltransferase [candidate division Zixibacteria bacterium]|nr:GNAT family N-acetyltransferase [candidate division Zixibacteria bacterium]